MAVTAFASEYSAFQYAYGIAANVPPLEVGTGNGAAGVGSIVLVSGSTTLNDGTKIQPIAVGTPITVGIGANAETVTPTGVTYGDLGSGGPGTQSVTVTATFANVHGPQEPVTSGSYGLQEAINAANGVGGGQVQVSRGFYRAGGTATTIANAVLPSNGSVIICDVISGFYFTNQGTSATVLVAPVAATSATVASLTTTGTWAASTYHVLFTYVNANGGETIASADYSFTATLNKGIGGTGPAAEAGAVGYRVYIGTNATTSCFMAAAVAANSLSGAAGIVQCGPIAAFKIGTSFSVATLTTNALTTNLGQAGLPPLVQATAFGAATPLPSAARYMAQPFQTVYPPFAATGTVSVGTAIELGHVQLPAGFLNVFGRTIKLKLEGYYTPVSTATLIITVAIQSVYGVTTTTVFTVTTPASSGTTAANINGEITIRTAATGATGTVECHGYIVYGGATTTAGLLVSAGDSVQAVSSAIDLTAQDVIVVSINSGTANLTTSQLRTLLVEVVN